MMFELSTTVRKQCSDMGVSQEQNFVTSISIKMHRYLGVRDKSREGPCFHDFQWTLPYFSNVCAFLWLRYYVNLQGGEIDLCISSYPSSFRQHIRSNKQLSEGKDVWRLGLDPRRWPSLARSSDTACHFLWCRSWVWQRCVFLLVPFLAGFGVIERTVLAANKIYLFIQMSYTWHNNLLQSIRVSTQDSFWFYSAGNHFHCFRATKKLQNFISLLVKLTKPSPLLQHAQEDSLFGLSLLLQER